MLSLGWPIIFKKNLILRSWNFNWDVFQLLYPQTLKYKYVCRKCSSCFCQFKLFSYHCHPREKIYFGSCVIFGVLIVGKNGYFWHLRGWNSTTRVCYIRLYSRTIFFHVENFHQKPSVIHQHEKRHCAEGEKRPRRRTGEIIKVNWVLYTHIEP